MSNHETYLADLIADHAHAIERIALGLREKLKRGEHISAGDAALVRDRIGHIVTVSDALFCDFSAPPSTKGEQP